jgi:UDP-3-O-acyl-N-acetylglucosamine deacetylase
VPAPAESGIAFVRTDLPKPVRIPLDIARVTKRSQRTSLMNGSVAVETVEHVLAAVWGLNIDNLSIELSAGETPSIDGSPMAFVEVLQAAGLEEQDAEQEVYVIDEPVSVADGEAMLAALPGPDDCLDLLYDLDYSGLESIGRQVLAFRLGHDDFVTQIAPARTFCTAEEAAAQQAHGIGTHLTAKDRCDSPTSMFAIRSAT